MGRSQETYGKKEVKNRKEKKRKEKEQKRAMKKSGGKKNTFEDMIAYVNEYGMITPTPPDPEKKTAVIAENIELSVTRNNPEREADLMRKGVVTFFNESKGFGFIRDLESDQRVFVHVKNLLEPITENNIVTFKPVKGPKGISATEVSISR